MNLLPKNSPRGKLSKQDFAIALDRLIWAIIAVVAAWLNFDLPDTIGDNSLAAFAVSGVAVYVGSILTRLISDYSKEKPDDPESEGAD